MIIHPFAQQSPEWFAHRATARNASDAPALMGESPYKTRSQFIEERATGIKPAIDAETQRRFDRGHEVEPALRALAEEIVGESFYPVTASSDDGYLSASFDGVTMDDSIILEVKQTNSTKMEWMAKRNLVPPVDYWQVVQQFAVNESAMRCLYMVGDGTREGTAFLWVDRALIELDIEDLRAAWAQADADVAAYVPREAHSAPEGVAPDQLPALRIELTGSVLATNLRTFREHAMATLRGINRDLQTDEDFVSAEKTVKWCSDVEDKIDAAKQHALSQTASIDELFRELDAVKDETRRIRLALAKLVADEKAARRAEIVQRAADSVRAHYDALNVDLGEYRIHPPQSIQFEITTAIKGLKTLASITNAAESAAANAKIAGTQMRDRVKACIAVIHEAVDSSATPVLPLIPDRVPLALSKTPDDLRNLIAARVAEAERIKLAQQEVDARIQALRNELDPEPCHGVLPAPAQKPAAREPIKLGEINAAISPLSICAAGLSKLGFEPIGSKGAAKLYAASDWPAMVAAMARHLHSSALGGSCGG